MANPPKPEALLTVSEVAERLNCSSKTVRRLIANGDLEALRIGPSSRLVRVSERALRVYLAHQDA